MSDPRVEKLAQLFEGNYAVPLFEAATMIETVEAADLLVVDANDPATVERVAKLMSWRSWHGWATDPSATPDVLWNDYVPRVRADWMSRATEVLAALAMPRD